MDAQRWRAPALGVGAAVVVLASYAAGTAGAAQRSTASSRGLSSAAPVASVASGMPAVDTVTVDADGTASGTPDTLVVALTAHGEAADAAGALAAASTAMAAVQHAATGAGVPPRDMKTSQVSLQPTYDYPDKGHPVLRGFAADEGLQVVLHAVKASGATINALVAAAGDAVRIDGVSLDLRDDGSLLTAARKDAFATARTKAQQYAALAGRPLGHVVSVTESVDRPTPQPMAFSASAGAANVPVQAGSQDVGVHVTVVWSLG